MQEQQIFFMWESSNGIPHREASNFERAAWRWWKRNRRNLPWRETKDPYRILVSEMMLQQTQVARVVPKYHSFLRAFPSLNSLADAKRADVIRLWSGLGYNRRAVALHQTAQHIATHQKGRVPTVFDELVALPGIGAYTARAILAFSGSGRVAPVDVNVARIFWRHFGVTKKNAQIFADHMAARQRRPSDWSQLLMDFGALCCTARASRCEDVGLSHAYPDVVASKLKEPFRGSNRYWRGRIVEMLRQKKATPVELRAGLRRITPDPIPIARFNNLLDDLARDGIIVRKKFLRLA